MSRTTQIFLFLLVCSVSAAAATFSLTGQVTDPSGAASAQAVIRLHARSSADEFSASSDAQGHFSLTLPAGEYLLQAEAPGLSLPQSPRRIAVDRDQTLTLQLGIAKVASSVVVTASGTSQSLTETGKAMDVVERSQWEQRGVESAVDSLRELPGIRLSQRGGPGSFATLQTRGLRAFDTAVLIDGMRFRDAGSPQGEASAFLSDLLLVDSSRIEVLRGAGSSLYGTNAIGGVVNMVTDPGGSTLHGSITADGGGLGEFRGVARVGGGAFANRLHYSAGLGHQNVTRGVDNANVYRNTTGNGLVDYALRPGMTLSARFLGTDVFGQLESNPFAVSSLPASGRIAALPLSDAQGRLAVLGSAYTGAGATFVPALPDADSYRTARFASTLLALQQELNPQWSYRLSYQALITARNVVDGPLGASYQPQFRSSSVYNGRIDTLQARTNLTARHHQLITAGYEFEREYVDSPAYDENPDLSSRIQSNTVVSEQSHTFDVQDQVRLLQDRLQISLAGRFQHFALSTPVFTGTAPAYVNAAALNAPDAYTGDVSLAYFVKASGTKLRSHVGNGYRKPSLYERYGTYISPFYFAAYGDPRLRPERSITVDAGVDQYLLADRLRVSATYFYTHLQQVIAFDFNGLIQSDSDPFGRSAGYYNTGGGLARGAELSMEARPWRSLRVQSSYTYTDARNRVSQFGDGTRQAARIFPHSFGLVAQQQFGTHIDASFDFLAASDYLYPFSGRTFVFPGPRLAGLAAGYTQTLSDRRKVRYYARVSNLLDQRYYEDGFRTPGRWAVAGITFSY
jgi:vitamin B12 transporter